MKQPFTKRRLLAALICGFAATAAQAGVAEIVGLSGKGEFRPDGDGKWREAKLKTQLEPASWVRTGAASDMALIVDPQVQIKLAANSLFQLKPEEKTQATTLSLRQGRAWGQAKPAAGSLKMETPSAVAAIHGTDWDMAVDADGNSTLTVVHGEVRFGNEHGTVTVGNGEQALAEPGKAPTKRLIANPAERVQWVTAFRVEPEHYAEYRGERGKALAGLVAKGDWRTLEAILHAQDVPVPADTLLLADVAIRESAFAAAALMLERGARNYPQDGRFPAALAHLALLKGEGTRALDIARQASERHPDSADAWLALAEAARFEGLADVSRKAFERADALDAADGRARLGLGRIAGEREDIAPARAHLAEALRRSPDLPDLAGEQGKLETSAQRWDDAQTHFDRALAQDPQDYIAQAELAQLRLRQGRDDEALDAVLRANLLEPRLARAYIYRAVAHHRRGESAIALEFLRQATERDAKDPMPHFMASLIHQDLGALHAAAAEARLAKQKLPFLKSLDPLAMDQKGSANVGSALAKLGLVDWARYYAQESHDPLWAGSHFFLADRYAGSFNKNSELMQGFLADPLSFGAGNRFQSLLPTPGTYLTLGGRLTRNDAVHYSEPSLVANGMQHIGFPVAWFFEGLRNDVRPGTQDLDATGNAYTLALGAKPRHDISLFVFGNRYEPEIERMGTTRREVIAGSTRRFDLGANLRLDPDTQVWLKAGDGSYSSHVDYLGSTVVQDTHNDGHDLQLRATRRFDRHELHFGAESADADSNTTKRGAGGALIDIQADTFRSLYAQGRYMPADNWSVEGGFARTEYRKNVKRGAVGDDIRQERWLPVLGAVWRPAPGLTLRGAWQDWIRSSAPHSLRPSAVAGIPIDAQLALPGGRQQRLRLQADWELAPTAFASAFFDARQVRNLGDAGLVLNTAEEVSDLNRLRDRGMFQNWGDPERLEGQPVFAAGRARQAGVAGNAFLGGGFTGSANYVHSVSRNTSDWFKDMPLPYLPRHRVGLGLDWSNEARLTAGGWLVWRSERNTVENGVPLPASWDLTLRMKWESADKRWQLEGWAANLLKKGEDTTLGVAVQWRY